MRGRRREALAFVSTALLVAACARRSAPPVDYAAGVVPNRLTTSAGLDVFPSFSPDGRLLACARDTSGAFEIHVVSLDGSGKDVAVTSDGKQNVEPSFSPDGEFIAYHSKERGGIWVVPASGGTPRPLADFGSKPAFSPNGDLVAFQSQNLTDFLATGAPAVPPSAIWVVPSRGGPARDVTHEGDPPGGHGAPTFSRDGKKIFFVVTDPKFDNATLFSVGVDGKDLARHFTFPRLFDPVIAPDGTTVLFGGGSAQLKYDIWRASIAPGDSKKAPVPLGVTGVDVPRHLALSSDGRRLAFSGLSTIGNIWSQPLDPKSSLASEPARALTKGGGTRNTWPVISPDGKRIAFGRQEPGSSHDVWMMDADGKNARPITSHPAVDFVQDWFPSGQSLLFTSNRSGEFRLYAVDVANGKVSPFPVSMKEIATPRLSPDGKSLAYGSRKGGITLNTWVMDIATGTSKALTFDRELFAYPCWSPDGKLLAAEVKRGDDVHVAVVPAAGGQPEQLTSATGLSWAFSFSPDGDKIAFAGYRRGFWNVWWVSRSTREEKRLTSFEKLNAFVRYPSWSRAGDQIVFEYAETTGNLWSLEFPRAAGSGR